MERLWAGIAQRDVAVVATDTCTFDRKQKAVWNGDFTRMAFGMPGVETMLPLMFSEGVGKGRIDLHRLVALSSSNPAKLFGMYPDKGSLAPGTDADIVVYDPKHSFTIRPDALQTNCDWSPFDGMELQGYPKFTLSRGRIVAETVVFQGELGWGKFLKRKRIGHVS